MTTVGKILIWYITLGGIFVLFLSPKFDLIVGAIIERFKNDPKKKDLSEEVIRKITLAIIFTLWPIFLYTIIKSLRR